MMQTHNSFCRWAVALSSSVVKNHKAPIFGSSLSDSMTPKTLTFRQRDLHIPKMETGRH